MKASKIVAAVALLITASGAFAEDGEGSRGRGGRGGRRGDSEMQMWYCRADARDDSGLFFYGMSRDRANAYVDALEACSRANRSCMINCSNEMNF